MVKEDYIPKKGDLVVLTFDPQAGHEQRGRRPALIVSNHLFNKHTGMAIACPITNTNREFPFHVPIEDDSSLTGYIMVEQVKSIDFRSRKIKFVESVSKTTLDDVLGILDACIYQDA